MLETIQTALTGSNVYYWFIAGFGNVDRLLHSHFAPIDIAFISAVILLLVQGYFCYQIWVMNNKWLSWICWIIAIVCIPTIPTFFSLLMLRSSTGWRKPAG